MPDIHVDVLALRSFVQALGWTRARLPKVPLPDYPKREDHDEETYKRLFWRVKECRKARTRWASVLEAAARELFALGAERMPEHLDDYIGLEYRTDQEIPAATWRSWLKALHPLDPGGPSMGLILIEDTRMALYSNPTFKELLAEAGLTPEAFARRTASLYGDMQTDKGRLAAYDREAYLLGIETQPSKPSASTPQQGLDAPYTPPSLPGRVEAGISNARFADVEDSSSDDDE